MHLSTEHLASLEAIVGPGAVRTAQDLAMRDPGVDPANLGADLMVRPGTTAEVARILAYCNAERIGVVPQGGRTGLSGGAESHEGEIIVALYSLERQPDREWRISGCELAPSSLQSI